MNKYKKRLNADYFSLYNGSVKLTSKTILLHHNINYPNLFEISYYYFVSL